MAKKQTGKVMWITRNNVPLAGYAAWSYNKFPRLHGPYYKVPWKRRKRWGQYSDKWFCQIDFENLTGIILAPGERIKARLVTG